MNISAWGRASQSGLGRRGTHSRFSPTQARRMLYRIFLVDRLNVPSGNTSRPSEDLSIDREQIVGLPQSSRKQNSKDRLVVRDPLFACRCHELVLRPSTQSPMRKRNNLNLLVILSYFSPSFHEINLQTHLFARYSTCSQLKTHFRREKRLTRGQHAVRVDVRRGKVRVRGGGIRRPPRRWRTLVRLR